MTELKSIGIHNYVLHPTTEILMLGWAFDDEPVEVWQPRLGPMPDRLYVGLQFEEFLTAFNSTFERYMFKYKLGIDLAIERFQDSQASSRYLSLPGNLKEVSNILGLPQDLAKDKEGERLIHMFSKPSKRKKKKGEEAELYFRNWETDPEEWAKFVEYCRQDVVAEREVIRREKLLGVFPLPPLERKIWIFDQKVNDRGIPVDKDFVFKALTLAEREKQEKTEQNNKLTGLENSNSNTQLLAWAKEQGYAQDSLEKEVVVAELKNNMNLTPLCREVLENRKSASSTSYKKMAAILRRVSPDNRFRNLFTYMGSSRCGRWNSNGYQFHNQARPTEIFEIGENIERARDLIFAEDYDMIKTEFGSVLLTVKSNIRTAFVAEKGNRFDVCDLSGIEPRVGAWMAGCEPLLNGFRSIKDFDPYMDLASKMSGIPYDILIRDKKSSDPAIKTKIKTLRQIAKPGFLACIYRAGPARVQAYAESMGIEMTLDQAEEIVHVYRESYFEIPNMWYAFEEAVEDVLQGTRVKRALGPNGCIKIDKVTIKDRKSLLRIQLPSGRFLHYIDAYLDDALMPWKDKEGNDVYKRTLFYSGQDQETKQWITLTSHGGKIFENVDQGIARDVLAVKMLDFEDAGMSTVLHVHDEGGIEGPDDTFSPSFLEMKEIMSRPIDWAPNLPLAAEGFSSTFYHK